MFSAKPSSALLCLAWLLGLPLLASADDVRRATGHVLVKFRPEVRSRLTERADVRTQLSQLLGQLGPLPGAALREPAVNQLLAHDHVAMTGDGKRAVDLDRFHYLLLPPGLSVEQSIRQLRRNPWIEYVEPDQIGSGGLTIPNDPDFNSQWHHRNLVLPAASCHTPEAWEITQGSSNILVAVLDTGASSTNAELSGRLVSGFDFVNNDSDPADDHGHGNAVAGTLAANANNGFRVAGVDWRCRILPLKVLDASNSGFYSWWAQAIDYAVARGARVINLSAGGGSSDMTLTRAITNAIARGVIFVTITHNDATNVIRFPGNLSQCITVGATDANDRRASFSNYGPQIDLVAPGVNIFTASRRGDLQVWNGTSFSAPLVAGVCSLLLSVRPNLTPVDVRTLLVAGAEDQVGDSNDSPGFDSQYGWGRLNAYNALVLAGSQIDQVRPVNGVLELSWKSPANASAKRPFLVEWKAAVTSPWVTLHPTLGFRYEADRTYWTDDGTQTGASPTRYYRLRLRAF